MNEYRIAVERGQREGILRTVVVSDVAAHGSTPAPGVNLGWRTVPTEPTAHQDAWLGHASGRAYTTVVLACDLPALRVTQRRSLERILDGDWFAIGDFIFPRDEYKDRLALRPMEVRLALEPSSLAAVSCTRPCAPCPPVPNSTSVWRRPSMA